MLAAYSGRIEDLRTHFAFVGSNIAVKLLFMLLQFAGLFALVLALDPILDMVTDIVVFLEMLPVDMPSQQTGDAVRLITAGLLPFVVLLHGLFEMVAFDTPF